MSYPNYKYATGLSNVGSYQVSGKPFVEAVTAPASGSTPVKVEFPAVTKEIVITNGAAATNDQIRVGFSALGIRDEIANYALVGSVVDGNGSLTMNVKATELYIMSDADHTPIVSVYASLTGIPVARITNISPSGSNWSGSVGIG